MRGRRSEPPDPAGRTATVVVVDDDFDDPLLLQPVTPNPAAPTTNNTTSLRMSYRGPHRRAHEQAATPCRCRTRRVEYGRRRAGRCSSDSPRQSSLESLPSSLPSKCREARIRSRTRRTRPRPHIRAANRMESLHERVFAPTRPVPDRQCRRPRRIRSVNRRSRPARPHDVPATVRRTPRRRRRYPISPTTEATY